MKQIIIYGSMLLLLVFGVQQCHSNIKQSKEHAQEISILETENLNAILDLQELSDSLHSVEATLIRIDGKNSDIDPEINYITKYVTSNKVNIELRNLRKQNSQYESFTDSLMERSYKLAMQNKYLESYCDSLTNSQDTVDSLIANSDIFPIQFHQEDLPWYSITGETNPDSTKLDFFFAEDYTITHRTDKVKRKLYPVWPFKKKVTQVIVSSRNPYKVNSQATVYEIK